MFLNNQALEPSGMSNDAEPSESIEQLIPSDIEVPDHRRREVAIGIGSKVVPRCTESYIGAPVQQDIPTEQLVGEPRAERVTGLIG